MEGAVINRRQWADGLRRLDLPPDAPVIAHASLSAFGPTAGGAPTVVDALLEVFSSLMMPVFTYTTMLTPEVGPPHNGLVYGAEDGNNRRAQFFNPAMPADRLMGLIPETLRRHPDAQRSCHPILSFTGVNLPDVLQTQTLHAPLAPLRALLDRDGWVLLLGVDHTTNTSIHLGEKFAGREAFTRWALTPQGVTACSGFPGCSDGFQTLAPSLEGFTRVVNIGAGRVQAFPLSGLVQAVRSFLHNDPLGLLCGHSYCPRCFDSRHRTLRRLKISSRPHLERSIVEEDLYE